MANIFASRLKGKSLIFKNTFLARSPEIASSSPPASEKKRKRMMMDVVSLGDSASPQDRSPQKWAEKDFFSSPALSLFLFLFLLLRNTLPFPRLLKEWSLRRQSTPDPLPHPTDTLLLALQRTALRDSILDFCAKEGFSHKNEIELRQCIFYSNVPRIF